MFTRFALIVGFGLMLNTLYAVILTWLLRRRKPSPTGLIAAVWTWVAAMVLLFAIQAFAPASWQSFLRDWIYLPMSVEMSWNVALPLFILPFTIILALVINRLRPLPRPTSELAPQDQSRRQFLYSLACGAAPVVALGMGVHGSMIRHDLRVRPLTIPVAGLPPELEGFSIAHVSDLHSGMFVGPERLKMISDATNDLKADMVTIAGDIINRDMAEFPPALAAIKAIESRHGTYLCEGNHDCIPGDGIVINACVENNLPMLTYQTVMLPVRGQRLIIGGLPWMKRGFEHSPELVSQLFPERQKGDIRILLAHHPHLFDIADSADLVLTGHTHGGQIMLTDEIGLGPAFFKYWSGLYQRGPTSMVVSNGCGDWFPCRINSPAEIALLRLTAA
jgi:predicted MPP superfamily phosphohydrolase